MVYRLSAQMLGAGKYKTHWGTLEYSDNAPKPLAKTTGLNHCAALNSQLRRKDTIAKL